MELGEASLPPAGLSHGPGLDTVLAATCSLVKEGGAEGGLVSWTTNESPAHPARLTAALCCDLTGALLSSATIPAAGSTVIKRQRSGDNGREESGRDGGRAGFVIDPRSGELRTAGLAGLQDSN